MTPEDVEKAIDNIVAYRDGIIKRLDENGVGADNYQPGMFERIEADFRALRKIQAESAPPMHKAPGGDGLFRMLPKWAGEPEH